jgi:hypothetical protein
MDISYTLEQWNAIQAGLILLLLRSQRRRNKRSRKSVVRSCWVRPWLQRRDLFGAYDTLMVELAEEDVKGYISFQRICPEMFTELLNLIGPSIEKQTTKMRMPIPPGIRLALTLRYLATGMPFYKLFFHIHYSGH